MNDKTNNTQEHPFFGEVIFAYSRAQAIEDGVLIEVDEQLAKQIGFVLPIALTSAAWESCIPVPEHLKDQPDQTEALRLADLLRVLRFVIRNRTECGQDRVNFQVLQQLPNGNQEAIKLKAICGPGDDPRPVLRISFDARGPGRPGLLCPRCRERPA